MEGAGYQDAPGKAHEGNGTMQVQKEEGAGAS